MGTLCLSKGSHGRHCESKKFKYLPPELEVVHLFSVTFLSAQTSLFTSNSQGLKYQVPFVLDLRALFSPTIWDLVPGT